AAGSHERLPLTTAEAAVDLSACVAAGAAAVHVHPRNSDSAESLHPADVAAWCSALRDAAPGVPISVTTAAWTEPELEQRLRLIQGWRDGPDLASVNLHETGALRVIELLTALGMGVEAGVWTVDDARLLVTEGLDAACTRVLVEIQDCAVPGEAVRRAAAIEDVLTAANVQAARLHHGEDVATWAVIDAAIAQGIDVRIGLEDTLVDRDGCLVAGNAALVTEVARRRLRGGCRA
ncbi:MAG: 3-keto-5-aminohexanoate cleavage protein, partial [Candidatus Dormibacteraeota bacterium]|nr:3-keto-5-aminohexanoate cleavage protein [Candidatus Dormibacteraeota bacterium]